MRYLITCLFIVITVSVVTAQDDCPTLERAAVAETMVWCVSLIPDSVCYGNPQVSADFDVELPFSNAGDLLPLASVNTINTARADNQFGIGLLQEATYGMNQWPAIDLRFVLFGTATLKPVAEPVPVNVATIVAAPGANFRAIPADNGRIITPLSNGATVNALGVSVDGMWAQVSFRDGRTGWITTSALSALPDDLPIVDESAGDVSPYPTRYSAIEINTGANDARCDSAPESGVLVQANQPNMRTRLQINQADVVFDGTLYLQADDDGVLAVHVVEGEATVTVDEESATVAEGFVSRVTVTTDDDGAVIGRSVRDAVAYDFDRLANLPIELLARPIYIGIDLSQIITPRPERDGSPIADVLVTEPCVITTGEGGANLRGGPGREFAIRGVLGFRETAYPIGRAVGTDGGNWWQLARGVWINAMTTVTGGDCLDVPRITNITVPPVLETE